jgi:integrase
VAPGPASRRPTRVGHLPRPSPFYASLLIAKGCSVKSVQRRLGHQSATETLDTYGHLWPDSDDETRNAVDLVLAGVARAG